MSKNLKEIYKGVYKRWLESQNGDNALKDIAARMKEDADKCARKLNKTNINRLRISEEKFLNLTSTNHLKKHWKSFQFILEHGIPYHFEESNINYAKNPKYHVKEHGFLYAISCRARPNLIKFGKTKNSIYNRVRQLMSRFKEFDYSLEFAVFVDDYSLLESLVEDCYKHLRVSGRTDQTSKEWYEINPYLAGNEIITSLISNQKNLNIIERLNAYEINSINSKLCEFTERKKNQLSS